MYMYVYILFLFSAVSSLVMSPWRTPQARLVALRQGTLERLHLDMVRPMTTGLFAGQNEYESGNK